jgi:hypothetical protein
MAKIINSTFMGQYGDLVDRIRNEWKKEQSDEMEIIQEFRDSLNPDRPEFRLYVVWEKFKDIPGPIRSKIIVHAYGRVLQEEYASEGMPLTEQKWQDHMLQFDIAIGASDKQEAAALGIPGYEEFE